MLQLWTQPDCYVGATWPDFYVFLTQTRDSDAATRSNFECGLKAIGGATPDGLVRVVREGHWAVGWIEWIAIHRDATDALCTANEIADALEDYPIVNEEHWSELECAEAEAFWRELPLRDRVELCRDHGINIFAARHEWVPTDDTGGLFEFLRSI